MKNKTTKQMLQFIGENESVTFDQIRFKFYEKDSQWYLSLNDLLFSGKVRRIATDLYRLAD